jgi:membrane fusion protein (multidrug efflux system)
MQTQVGKFVYVVSEGKAVLRPVEIVSEDSRSFVLSSGLKSGDVVILDNQTKLRPGSLVVASSSAAGL